MQGSGPYPPAGYGQSMARGGQPSTSAAAVQPNMEDLVADKVCDLPKCSDVRGGVLLLLRRWSLGQRRYPCSSCFTAPYRRMESHILPSAQSTVRGFPELYGQGLTVPYLLQSLRLFKKRIAPLSFTHFA